MKTEEYFAISRDLEKHHALFYAVWELGKPVFTTEIPTAAVRFNPEGECIEFVFNPDYWESLDEYQRRFVICHECLHVILNHGARIRDADFANRDACNVALDIVVNHMLVNRFGFERSKIFKEKSLCWTDTVFPNQPVPDDDCFEYYYNLLPRISVLVVKGANGSNGMGSSKSKGLEMPDDHESLGEGNWEEAIGKMSESMSEDEKETVRDLIEKHYQPEDQGDEGGQQAGTGTTGRWEFANVEKVAKKKKWETVIKKWSMKFDRPEFHDIEQWARINRRFAMLSGELMLPSDMEQEYEMEGKVEVWFFQDTSGSCAGYRDRFFKAASTLDPKRFNLHLHCFDTQVYETTLESKKLYGFGGTAFQPIEDFIQVKVKEEKLKYPEAVFVITDGYGNKVTPEKPKHWYWFLTTTYRSCIPDESLVFNLKDFE